MKATTTLALLIALAAVPQALGHSIVWQRYSGQVLEEVFYGDLETKGLPYFAQLATEALIPIFKEMKGKDMTLVMPNPKSYAQFVVSKGGNWSDPRTFKTKEFKAIWNEVHPYFFYYGLFNASEVPDGTTVELSSMKPSPAGDWTLPIAYRRETGMEEAVLAELNTTWNGTFYSSPFGSGNVTFPAFSAVPEVNAVAVDFWPTEPKSLTETIAAVDVTNWEAITSRISFALDLDAQRNFTLFLPPSDALASALALSDGDLTAFVSAHIVPSRVLLSLDTQTFTTVGDKALSASGTWVKVGSTNATITSRDILTNGGVLQVIDRSLA